MSKNTDYIVTAIGEHFRTFGGGEDVSNTNNPVSMAMADKPLMFAAGVDVKEVVVFVLQACSVMAAKAMQCRYYQQGKCIGGPTTCGITAGRYTNCSDWRPRKRVTMFRYKAVKVEERGF